MLSSKLLKVFQTDCTFAAIESRDLLENLNCGVIPTFDEKELGGFAETESHSAEDPSGDGDGAGAVEKISPSLDAC